MALQREKLSIAVLDDYHGVAAQLANWSGLGSDVEVQFFPDRIVGREALVDRLSRFSVICPMRERTIFDRALIERLTELRLIVATGNINASVDLAAARDRGITVCSTRSDFYSTPEFVWGLIFSVVRRISAHDSSMHSGEWRPIICPTLRGRTLGILGLGTIGAEIARIGTCFGMDPIAWSPNLTAERARAAGARRVTKDELFRQSDVLTVQIRLGESTRGLVGASELALMKSTSYLINTSRGPIVSEPDLVTALKERRIAGAGLDVFDTEPLPADHPLRSLDNVVLTPHVGYLTEEMMRIFYRDAVEDIAAWQAGAPIRMVA